MRRTKPLLMVRRVARNLAARVLFDPASRGPLLEMARGQRVRFQGILRPLNGNASVEVEDARVITESGK